MFSHIVFGCSDLSRAAEFYNALLAPLGLRQQKIPAELNLPCVCWGQPDGGLPRFCAYRPFDGNPPTPGNGTMVSFLAPSPEAVDTAYAAGLAAGGISEGEPGPRPHYGEGYYGAYLRDLDGNKIHIVHRGDLATGKLT